MAYQKIILIWNISSPLLLCPVKDMSTLTFISVKVNGWLSTFYSAALLFFLFFCGCVLYSSKIIPVFIVTGICQKRNLDFFRSFEGRSVVMVMNGDNTRNSQIFHVFKHIEGPGIAQYWDMFSLKIMTGHFALHPPACHSPLHTRTHACIHTRTHAPTHAPAAQAHL